MADFAEVDEFVLLLGQLEDATDPAVDLVRVPFAIGRANVHLVFRLGVLLSISDPSVTRVEEDAVNLVSKGKREAKEVVQSSRGILELFRVRSEGDFLDSDIVELHRFEEEVVVLGDDDSRPFGRPQREIQMHVRELLHPCDHRRNRKQDEQQQPGEEREKSDRGEQEADECH